MTSIFRIVPALLAFLVGGFVGVAQAADPLVGTWRLVSAMEEAVDTKVVTKGYGEKPTGFVTFTPEGRILSILVGSDRKRPVNLPGTDAELVELWKSMVALAGTYKIDGKTVTIHVDVSWNQAWTGTDLKRVFELRGDRLEWKTLPFWSAIMGKQIVSMSIWERVK